jgi:hypothetical protein
MKVKDGSLRHKIRQAFAAFTYEHSGEMLSVQRKGQVLSGARINHCINKNKSTALDKKPSSSRILMSVDKVIEPELLKYTVDAAKQFNASIDIISKQSYDEIYKNIENEVRGSSVNWQLIKLDEELLSGITDYVSNYSNVLFIVTDPHKVLSGCSEKSRYAA